MTGQGGFREGVARTSVSWLCQEELIAPGAIRGTLRRVE